MFLLLQAPSDMVQYSPYLALQLFSYSTISTICFYPLKKASKTKNPHYMSHGSYSSPYLQRNAKNKSQAQEVLVENKTPLTLVLYKCVIL